MAHLAQYNLARTRATLDDPLMAEFVGGLARVNAAADAAAGFVWRLKGEGGGGSSYVRVYDDERIIVTLSVWESVEALRAYTYSGAHVQFFRRRAEWFAPHTSPSLVMWWIEEGHVPTLAEAVQRMADLVANGPTER